MEINKLRSRAGSWQARLRLMSLLTLLGIAGLTGGLALAQTPAATVNPAVQQSGDSVAPADIAAAEPFAGTVVERFGVREMFVQADLVVKSVMLFLVFCSLLTWAILFEKLWAFSTARRRNRAFINAFRHRDTAQLTEQASCSAVGRIWQAAQAELKHFDHHRGSNVTADQINRLLQRMSLSASVVQEGDLSRLGAMMGVLATIGATAPFIGLFGTVWGILNSFAGIATMKTASLAVVAPGIAEALLATALGLFAAIPAVMIFNKFARDINGFVGTLDNFCAELLATVSRQMDEAR
ncbi:MotA/TolQ/ExbB proton channel family protein [Pseudomonas sp. FME51]|uniref:MotA/TolQ/ExbB proton channel family protein n=1 Tax=Pseudomonas sp. FME51 TaxID=2742609 RepID=UPI00299F8938|nr:MotA/TolQ/ExbB proton channel family protein [Pseudomonas sp. FME51]